MDDPERRIAIRRRVTFGAACDDGDGMRSGRVLDLSLTGAFIHMTERPPMGTELVLFPLDHAAEGLFEIRARVVRHVVSPDLCQAPGVGVEFVGMGTREHRALRRLMAELPATSSASLTHMPVMRELPLDEGGRLADPAANRAWARIGVRMFKSRRAG